MIHTTILNHNVQIEHHTSRISCSKEEFTELWNIYNDIEPTPNPLNKKVMIKRKQCTFGGSYHFAGQTSREFNGTFPVIVNKVLQDVQKISYDGDLYNVIHANYYPDGTSGLMPHFDDESKHIKLFTHPQVSKQAFRNIFLKLGEG